MTPDSGSLPLSSFPTGEDICVVVVAAPVHPCLGTRLGTEVWPVSTSSSGLTRDAVWTVFEVVPVAPLVV